MSENSKIPYVNASWNPLGWGCFGPGGTAEKPNRCPYCFAHRQAQRHLRKCPECNAFVPHFHRQEMLSPLKWKKARRIFVCSMSDLFGDTVEEDVIWDVLRTSYIHRQHTYLFLTKNPKRMAEEVNEFLFEYDTPRWECNKHWFGVSITNQDDAGQRIPILCGLHADNLWLSIEPIMGPVDLKLSLAWLDWIVIGAETGNRKRKVVPDPKWIEDIIGQCKVAGVPVFVKGKLAEAFPVREYPKGWR